MTFAVAANEKGEKVLTMPKYIEAARAATIIAEKRGIPIADLVDTFAEIPAADVAPVVHGRWEKHGSKWQCTGCKVLMSIDGTPQENLLYYCPFCGAKMDKEE